MILKYHNKETWKRMVEISCYGNKDKAVAQVKASIILYSNVNPVTDQAKEKTTERINMLKEIFNELSSAHISGQLKLFD